jgi:secondary thiamine-phosphate synthase enzyme
MALAISGAYPASMRTKLLELDTTGRHIVDLTADIRSFASESGDGLLNVFVPHATAGVAIIELGDGSEPDFAELLERLLPKDRRYNHHHGSPGHGADHLLPTLFSPSLVLPVVGGTPQLGTWQYVVLVYRNDDNPRRQVRLSFVDG